MTGETTIRIQTCLERMQEGDASAQNDLLVHALRRLEHLAHKLFADFHGLRRFVGSEDVLQSAAIRLTRALETTPPQTARGFFRLAALQIRRELIDLARHYRGPEGAAANQVSWPDDMPTPQADNPSTLDPARLAEWTEFHGKLANLPDEEREVADLLWYHGLSQQEAADLLGTSLRTVKRRWQRARLLLHTYLQDGDVDSRAARDP
jgi:RNA polymerase sigma-70 factor (ECF subfamily)